MGLQSLALLVRYRKAFSLATRPRTVGNADSCPWPLSMREVVSLVQSLWTVAEAELDLDIDDRERLNFNAYHLAANGGQAKDKYWEINISIINLPIPS